MKEIILQNKKKLLVLIGLVIVLVIGSSYAWFNYSKVGTLNNVAITGDIYLNLDSESNSISLENAMPESAADARSKNNNYIDFTISGKNTTPKDIYYQILVKEGDAISGKNRLHANDLAFDLYELDAQNNATLLLDAVSYEDLNNHKMWVDYIEKQTSTVTSKKYRLRMWIAQKTVYGTGSAASYTVDQFKNSYANAKIVVDGYVSEKSFPLKFSYDETNKRFLMTVWNDYFTRDAGIAADDDVTITVTDPKNKLLFSYTDNNSDTRTNQSSLTLEYDFDQNKKINVELSVANIGKYGSDVKFVVSKNNVVVQSFLRPVYDSNSTDRGTKIATVTYHLGANNEQTQDIYDGIDNYVGILIDDPGFVGWSTSQNGSVGSVEYEFGDKLHISSNTTLYPAYRRVVGTITYNLSNSSTTTQNLYEGITNHVLVSDSDSNFIGWAIEPNGIVKYVRNSAIEAESVTLYPISSSSVQAVNLSYVNTNTELECTDAQCALDAISDIINGTS